MAALFDPKVKTSFLDPETRAIVIADILVSRADTYTNEVTDFPIYSGDYISDHVIKKPISITLDCAISNTPIATGSVSLTNEGSGKYSGSSGSDGTTNDANTAYEQLVSFRENKTALTVQNGLVVMQNMMITSLTIPQKEKTNHVLYFTIALKQVRVVVSTYVQIKNIDSSLADKTSAPVNNKVKGEDASSKFDSPAAIALGL